MDQSSGMAGRATRPARVIAQNRLLAALSTTARRHVLGGHRPFALKFGAELCAPGERQRHVYFPTNGFISLLTPDGAAPRLEVGLVGAEGVVGVGVVLGVDEAPLRAIVQGAGVAWRLTTAEFRAAIARHPALRREVDRYLFVLMNQLAQTTACTRFHHVEQRLARWLLMSHDRAQDDRFRVTQLFLGQMLGVRRSGVSRAASALQQQRIISYSRGTLTVLNRRALESAACGCYRAVQDISDRILA